MAKRTPRAKRESTKITAPPVSRGEGGKWLPGHSANPGGRPGIAEDIARMARADSPEAYAKVVSIMQHDGDRQQLAAALAILKVAGVFRNAEAPAPTPPVPHPSLSDAGLDAALAAVN